MTTALEEALEKTAIRATFMAVKTMVTAYERDTYLGKDNLVTWREVKSLLEENIARLSSILNKTTFVEDVSRLRYIASLIEERDALKADLSENRAYFLEVLKGTEKISLDGERFCPACFGEENHRSDCPLSEAIKRAEGEKK